MASTAAHSASRTGDTDRRAWRNISMPASAGLALIRANVTGWGSALSGASDASLGAGGPGGLSFGAPGVESSDVRAEEGALRAPWRSERGRRSEEEEEGESDDERGRRRGPAGTFSF